MRLSSKPDVSRLQARRDIDGLISALGYTQDPGVREAASRALVGLGASAIPLLVQSLDQAELRDSLVQVLVEIGPLAVDPLVQTLKTTSNAGIRAATVAALARMGMLAVDPLIAVMRHRSESVRQAAGAALAGIGSFAVEPLVRILTDSVEPSYVRRSAAVSLGLIRGTRVASALTTALRDEHSDEVRAAIRESLEAMGVQQVAPAAPGPERPARPAAGAALSWPGKAVTTEGASPVPSQAEEARKRQTTGSLYRWTRFRGALPELRPVDEDVIRRLRQNYPVSREYMKADAVVSDVEEEYANYSRLREAEYASVSVKLVFDNYVEREGYTAPATRQLEVVVVYDGAQFIVFYNAGFVEFW